MKLSLAIFKNRTFRNFWLAGALSSIGDALFNVALIWLLAEQTGSPAIVGTYLFVIGTTRLVFVLLGGAIVDQFDVRKLLIAADVIRAVAMFAFGLLFLNGDIPIWAFYVLGFIFGVVESVTTPGGAFVATQIVPKKHYTQSMSIFLVTDNTAGIVGPLVGAAFLLWGGALLAIAANGLSFALSALLLLSITIDLPLREGKLTLATLLQELVEGFRFFIRNRVIMLLSISGFFANAALGLAVLATPFLVTELGRGVEGYGLVQSSIGIGGVIGGALLALLVIAQPTPRMALLTTFSQGLLFLMIGLTNNFWLIVVAFALVGLNEAAVNVIAPSVNHTIIPRALFGRVIAVMMIVMEASEPLFQAGGGWLMETVDVHTVFLLGGAMEVGVALLIFFLPSIRDYRPKNTTET